MNILKQADKLVNGDRQKAYDHPKKNFQRIADLWSAYLKGREGDLRPEDVAQMLILLKVAREMFKHKDDNVVDGIGYFLCLDKIVNE